MARKSTKGDVGKVKGESAAKVPRYPYPPISRPATPSSRALEVRRIRPRPTQR